MLMFSLAIFRKHDQYLLLDIVFDAAGRIEI